MCTTDGTTLASAEKHVEKTSQLQVGNVTEELQEQQSAFVEMQPQEQQTRKSTSFVSKVNKFVGKSEPVETNEQRKAVEIKHYNAVKKEEFTRRESVRVGDVQNQALEEMCNAKAKLPHATKEFKEVIESILTYLHTEAHDAQQSAYLAAQTKIQAYLDSHDSDENDLEYELWMHVQAFGTYLEMNTNGSLDMKGQKHQKGEHEKNPKSRVLAKWTSAKEQCLFPHEPSVHDIQQRTVQDCYMMASLAAIAHMSPEIIKQSMKDNGDGTVTVRFYDEKKIDTYYTDVSIESMLGGYAEAKEEDKKLIDRKILAKLFSSFTVDESVEARLREKWAKEEIVIEQAPESEEVNAEVNTEEIEGIDDFEFVEEEFETTATKSEEGEKDKAINRYATKAKNLQDSFKSSNEAWLNEMIDKLLSSTTEAGAKLQELLTNIHATQSDYETMSRVAFESFIEEVCKSDSLNDAVFSECREVRRSTRENQRRYEPTYVTVTKEVARFAGAVDAYAADSLWVQMIEKAAAIHYGGEDGYEGISLGKSYEFLRHFLNQDYDPGLDKYIITSPMEGFEINNVQITPEVIQEKVRVIQKQKKSVAVSIEDMLKLFEKDSAFQAIFSDRTYVEQLATQLVQQFGMLQAPFSHKYTDQANAIYEDYKERLERKECIAVGCNYDEELVGYLKSSGIRNGHAYSIIDCFEKDGHKFVTLRDPYALFKREYVKSVDKDGNESYKIENASQVGLSKNDSNGLFNMELNDFLMTFNEYTAIKQG